MPGSGWFHDISRPTIPAFPMTPSSLATNIPVTATIPPVNPPWPLIGSLCSMLKLMLGPPKSTTLGPCETARTSSTERRCPEAPGQMKRKRRTRRRAGECTAERGISSSKIGGKLSKKCEKKQETCGCFWMILVNGIDLKRKYKEKNLGLTGKDWGS